ncbi:MAG: hypothetical protein ACI8VT_002151, partial [Saprospiraceae bacterium]
RLNLYVLSAILFFSAVLNNSPQKNGGNAENSNVVLL